MTVVLFSLFISLFTLSLFYYWFAVANRYLIFLYFHLDAMPFDDETSSRYWMAGLVAMGLVLILYTGVNWILGRLATWRQILYRAPRCWQVWLWCFIPLSIGIPLITMRFNMPTLPFNSAVTVAAVTLGGLMLALLPGGLAASRPFELVWLTAEGFAILLMFTLLPALETAFVKPDVVPLPLGILVAIISVLFCLFWTGVMTGLRKWRGKPAPAALAVYVAGLCLSYLLLPVLHYLFRGYISVSVNFFASSFGVQLLVWGATAALLFPVTKLRQRILH